MSIRRPASVAIIIPTLGSPQLATVLGAVRDETGRESGLDIVVVGAADRQIVDRFGARFISTDRRLSAAQARNLGASSSTAEKLIFLDSDCIPLSGWFDSMIQAMCDNHSIVSGSIHIVPDKFIRVAGNVASFHEFTSGLPIGERPYLASFSLGVPRSAFEQVQGFDERFPISGGEDLDFTIRLSRAGYRLLFVPSARVVHRPERCSLASIWHHSLRAGRNSIGVRKTYPAEFRMPGFLFSWPILLAATPLLSGAVTLRALARNGDVRAHVIALPVMYLSRVAWVVGAVSELCRDGPALLQDSCLKSR
jgi:GT2 family glycosyltransferase